MAITATIALSAATAKSGQRRTVTCTVSNSGGADVYVTGIVPKMPINGRTDEVTSVALSAPYLGPGKTTSVAAGGSTAFSWQVTAHEPTTNLFTVGAEASSLVYSCGATIYTSDGAITTATPATLTVTNPAGL